MVQKLEGLTLPSTAVAKEHLAKVPALPIRHPFLIKKAHHIYQYFGFGEVGGTTWLLIKS